MKKINYVKYPLLFKIIQQIIGILKMPNTFELRYQGKKILSLSDDKIMFDGENSPRGFLATSYYDLDLKLISTDAIDKLTKYLGISKLDMDAEKALLVKELLYFKDDSSLIQLSDDESTQDITITIEKIVNIIRGCLKDSSYTISIENNPISTVGIVYDTDDIEYIVIETENGYLKESDMSLLKPLLKIEKYEIIDINTLLG